MEDYELDIVIGAGPGRAVREDAAAALHADRRHHARRAAHVAARARASASSTGSTTTATPTSARSSQRSARILGVADRRRRGGARSRGARAARRASPTGCSGACATTRRCAPTAAITLEVARARCRCSRSTSTASTNGPPLLRTIIDKFGGGPVGVGSLAAALSEDATRSRTSTSRFLIQAGFLDRTPRGRVATPRAYEYFGLTAPRKDRSVVTRLRAACRVGIASLATYVPPKLLTNADLEKMVETSDEWILQRTGIRERHIVEPAMATSDLANEGRARRHRAGGHHAGPDRLHRRRHDHARHDVPEHRVPGAGQDRRDQRLGLRSRRGLLRLHLCADDAAIRWSHRRQQARAGDRRRRDVEHHRLHRSHHLRLSSATAPAPWSSRRPRRRRHRHHRLRQRNRRQRRSGALHAGRRQPPAGLARDRRSAAALREAGRPGGVPVRRAQHRGACRRLLERNGVDAGRHRSVRVAPGQPAHHPRRGREARAAGREGRHQPREVRQHDRRDDSARAQRRAIEDKRLKRGICC